MEFLYNLVWRLLTPLVPLVWQYRARKGKEDPVRHAERFGYASQPRPSGILIWLHAASVGESLSLLSLIDELKQHNPAWRYLITTGTVTSATLMAARLPTEAIHQYVPFDHPAYVARFIKHWRPNGVLWVESEIWPNLVSGIRQLAVPAVLLNARISEKSVRKWAFCSGYFRRLLSPFSLVAAQTAGDAMRLQPFVDSSVVQLGNLKFVSKPLPVDQNKLAELQRIIADRPVWLMASTHAPEENIALQVHQQLKLRWPNILTVIALRHPVRGADVAAELGRSAQIARRSQGEMPQEIYLCDTLGEMGVLYSTIKTVVMGGSFTVGGHNPIEPAQFSCAVVCGPLMYNFTAITESFNQKQALLYADNANQLAATVAGLISDDAKRQAMGMAANSVTVDEAKSLGRIWQALMGWRTAIESTAGRVTA